MGFFFSFFTPKQAKAYIFVLLYLVVVFLPFCFSAVSQTGETLGNPITRDSVSYCCLFLLRERENIAMTP